MHDRTVFKTCAASTLALSSLSPPPAPLASLESCQHYDPLLILPHASSKNNNVLQNHNTSVTPEKTTMIL